MSNLKKPLDWIISKGLIDYQEALKRMESRVEDIIADKKNEAIWLLEHPDIYTAGTSANFRDLKDPKRFPVITTNRGGQFTYHGPGQRIVYVMIKLGRFDYDIRKYVHFLEDLVIKTLKDFNITSHRWEKAIGVWTYKISTSKSSYHLDQYKIASIGVRVRRKIAFHGVAINIAPNIQNFEGIIPCGIKNAKVTSVFDQGVETSMADFDKSLKSNFNKLLKTYPP
ncbi:MAG: lipoate-protein ligase B [Rhodobacteraceae bacterium]|nr:MAG: lipoate-protein ligase B [Paracoccaceae bacterium]|tara:strand:+ start:179 stop:853 length:675 start_codon:yes stop_codon:yes gene_type:complete